MASIYEIRPGTGCLLLDIREGLVYPFDFGTGWKEISMGLMYALENVSGTTQGFTSDRINGSNINDRPAIGFTSRNQSIPMTNGNVFFGVYDSNNITEVYSAGVASIRRVGFPQNSAISLTFNNEVLGLTTYFSQGLLSSTRTGMLDGQFGILGLRLNIQGNIYSGQGFQTSQGGPDNSESFLRQFLNSKPDAGTIITGYYTHDHSSTGITLPKPDAIIAYLPFYLNRLRIHNILVQVMD